MNKETKKRDVHRDITDTIIQAIEDGVKGGQLPWYRSDGPHLRPRNARTGNGYNGVNVLVLWAQTEKEGYDSSQWATFKQWKDLGARVRRHEKGSPAVFYKELTADQEDPRTGKQINIPYRVARTSWVFNANQVQGYEAPAPTAYSLVEAIENADAVIRNSGAVIVQGGDEAYYHQVTDRIHMPDRNRFRKTRSGTATEHYYAVLLHELVHHSGAEHRLNRDLGDRFGDQAYAMEELVAELGAAFLCADLGVTNETRADHAVYISGWLEILRTDKHSIFTAAGKAGEATEYLKALSEYKARE